MRFSVLRNNEKIFNRFIASSCLPLRVRKNKKYIYFRILDLDYTGMYTRMVDAPHKKRFKNQVIVNAVKFLLGDVYLAGLEGVSCVSKL